MFLWRAEKGNKLAGAGTTGCRALLIGFRLAVWFFWCVCVLPQRGEKPPRNTPSTGVLGVEHFCVPLFSCCIGKQIFLLTVFNLLEQSDCPWCDSLGPGARRDGDGGGGGNASVQTKLVSTEVWVQAKTDFRAPLSWSLEVAPAL